MDGIHVKPPMIVVESGDADVFETFEEALRYLEPYDVDKFVGYDSEGRLLRFIAAWPRITIESAEERPRHAEDARKALIKFLQNVRASQQRLEDSTLQELFEISLNYKTR